MLEQTHRHAAIMFTDIVGYTALMGSDEDKAFEVLKNSQEIHKSCILKFNGTLIKEMGDGMLISFNLASEAVRCAIEIQKTCKEQDIPLKIGIHEGEMVFADTGTDVLGDSVNIASRLQEDADEGCIHISSSVYKNVRNKAGINTSFVEERTFKNVEEPVKVYKVLNDGEEAQTVQKKTKKAGKQYLFYLFGVVIIVLAILLIRNYFPTSAPSEINKEKSIAVMPFDNESADEGNEYFVNGMMDAIRNNLSKIGDLRIIGKTSTEKYRQTTLSSIEIGNELSANYLLHGTVQKLGDQINIYTQLVEAENDDQIWQDRYLRDISDIEEVFKIQGEIAQAIADELKVVITPEEKERIASIPTEYIEAYDLYLKAKFLWAGGFEDYSYIEELLEKAIQIDSGFADAYAWLGFFKSRFWWFGDSELSSPEEAFNTGWAYYEKAYELDPENINALHFSASSLGLYRWDFKAVEEKMQILDELDPDLLMTGRMISTGRYKEAVRRAEVAFESDPFSSEPWRAKILSYYFNNQEDKALQAIETTLKGDFRNIHIDMDIIWVYLNLEMYNKAIAVTDQAFQRYNYKDFIDRPRPLCYRAIAYYHTGNIEESIEILNTIQERSEEFVAGSPFFYITMIYAQMGEIDLAFEWLEKAYEDHEVEMYWLKVDPLFEPLRSDPRWQEMLDKVGFPD